MFSCVLLLLFALLVFSKNLNMSSVSASKFTWATERLWREFGEDVKDTVVVVRPSIPVEAVELDGGETQVVLRN